MRVFLTVALLGLGLQGCMTTNYKAHIAGTNKKENYQSSLGLSPSAQKLLKVSASSMALEDKSPGDALIIYAVRKANANATNRSIALALIYNSDMLCELYMVDVIKISNTTSAGLKLSNQIFSAAAGVTTPVRSANLLGGLATLSAGTEQNLKKELLGDKAPDIIYKAVWTERLKKRTEMLTMLADENSGEAGAASVISEIQSYHTLCGTTVGLGSISASVDAAQKVAKQEGDNIAKAALTKIMKEGEVESTVVPKTDAAKPEAAKPDAPKPEAAKAEVAKPEAEKPEAEKPKAVVPQKPA